MVMILAAWAAPLDDLPPLPACSPDAGLQQALPARVFDLLFDDDRLHVADWGGLSLRDDALRVIDVPAPGSHGWLTLALDDDGAVLADHTFGDGFPRQRRHGLELPPRVLVTEFRFPARTTPTIRRSMEERPPLPDWTPKGRWTGPPRAHIDWGVPGRHRALHIVAGRPSSVERLHAIASGPEGRVATASAGTLRLHGPDGDVLAEQPILPYTDAAGIVRDRLFTVQEGELRIWGHDGTSWRAPGAWTSALEDDGDLLVADALGRLHRMDLDAGTVQMLACTRPSCAPVPGDLPAPPTGGDAATLGPRAMQWWNDLVRFVEDRPVHPVALHRVHGRVVVAHLEPYDWAAGVPVVTALSVMDPALTTVTAHRDGFDAPMGTVQAGAPGTLALMEATLSGPMPEMLTLADLEPAVGTAPEGPAVRTSAFHPVGSDVVLGRYVEGSFQPAHGLPPRHALQQRSHAVATFADDRVVLSASFHGGTSVIGGNTEVWCTPRMEGPPATVLPGVLSRSLRERSDRDHALIDHALVERPTRRLRDHGTWIASLADVTPKPTWIWVDDGSDVDPLLDLGLKRLRVHSDRPRPRTLPRRVAWGEDASLPVAGTLALVERGIVVWSGTLDRFDPLLLERERRGPTVSDEVQARWTVRNPMTPATPPEPAPAASRHRPVVELPAGSPFPEDAITWDRAPDARTVLVHLGGRDGTSVWKAADELGIDAAAVVWLRPVEAANVLSSIAFGRWTDEDAERPASRYVLVHDGQVIGSYPSHRDDGLRTALEELPN
jgi:hypothetical protein